MSEALASGRSAFLADGSVVTPLADSGDVGIHRGDGRERAALALPDDAIVLDVDSSPDGSLLAVSIGIGAIALERRDAIGSIQHVRRKYRRVIARIIHIGRMVDLHRRHIQHRGENWIHDLVIDQFEFSLKIVAPAIGHRNR